MSSDARRDEMLTLAIYALLGLALVALAWIGQLGPGWGRVEAADSPLHAERLEQALREMGD